MPTPARSGVIVAQRWDPQSAAPLAPEVIYQTARFAAINNTAPGTGLK